MRQADIFLEGEGDRWLERNRAKLGEYDPVSSEIARNRIKPMHVLEIGCANGWRLEALRDRYGCEVFGVEPSRQGCIEAAGRRIAAIQSSASCLSVNQTFDMVIYGFCLYLTDPDEWLRIAAEGDWVLQAGGYLIIHDFKAHEEDGAFARKYSHLNGLVSYHYDFANLWLGSSRYRQVSRRELEGGDMVTILKKDISMEIKP